MKNENKITSNATVAASSLLFFIVGASGAIMHGLSFFPIFGMVATGISFVFNIREIATKLTEE
jgi:hypothetical protein